jgi:hypothetical protein
VKVLTTGSRRPFHPSLGLVNHATTRPVEEALYLSDLDFTVLQPARYMRALAPLYQQALNTGTVAIAFTASPAERSSPRICSRSDNSTGPADRRPS